MTSGASSRDAPSLSSLQIFKCAACEGSSGPVQQHRQDGLQRSTTPEVTRGILSLVSEAPVARSPCQAMEIADCLFLVDAHHHPVVKDDLSSHDRPSDVIGTAGIDDRCHAVVHRCTCAPLRSTTMRWPPNRAPAGQPRDAASRRRSQLWSASTALWWCGSGDHQSAACGRGRRTSFRGTCRWRSANGDRRWRGRCARRRYIAQPGEGFPSRASRCLQGKLLSGHRELISEFNAQVGIAGTVELEMTCDLAQLLAPRAATRQRSTIAPPATTTSSSARFTAEQT